MSAPSVAIGTTLVLLFARPSRGRELIWNDVRIERARLVDDLNTMIMEEVERQQGTPRLIRSVRVGLGWRDRTAVPTLRP